MAIIKYSDLLTDVLPFLAADPSNPLVETAIKRSVIDFCAGSWVWKQLADPVDVEAGENTYDLEPDTGADVLTIMDVAHNNIPIVNKSTVWLDAQLPGWLTTKGTPKFFTQVNTDQLILAPVPEAASLQGLTMTLVLQPSQTAKGFPKWIATQYQYSIVEGALARLMLMPKKPWTDLENGIDRRNRFETDIANARANAVAALGRAVLRTSPNH